MKNYIFDFSNPNISDIHGMHHLSKTIISLYSDNFKHDSQI